MILKKLLDTLGRGAISAFASCRLRPGGSLARAERLRLLLAFETPCLPYDAIEVREVGCVLAPAVHLVRPLGLELRLEGAHLALVVRMG